MKSLSILILFSIILISCKENNLDNSNSETTSAYDVRSVNYFNTPKELNIGDRAPNFIMNPDSKYPVELNHFRNKTVLISFGASWCVYCRLFEPKLYELSNKFKNKNFEIISVLIDYKEEDFINKLNPDYNIYHVFNQDRFKNLPAIYPIDFFPFYYLVDTYGNIIGKGNPNSNSMFELLENTINSK